MELHSPFTQIFGTNYVPTDEEVAQIEGLLRTRRTRLKFIEAELKNLQALEAALSSDIQHHLALLSPARRLPSEILLEIFRRCLPSTHNATLSPKEAPSILTQICRHWRHLALTSPSLWQSIHISDGRIIANSVEFCVNYAYNKAKAIQAWFERSAGGPLNISLFEAYPKGLSQLTMNAILNVSGRWKIIRLCTTPDTMEDLFHGLKGSTVPVLQTLSLSLSTTSQHPQQRLNWTEDQGRFNAPLLTAVLLTGVGGDYSAFPIKWSQLTHLTLQKWTMFVAGFGMILRKCPNLRSCRIDMPTNGRLGEHFPHYTHPIILRSLERLSIREWKDDFALFFRLLDAPSLRYLECRKSGTSPVSCTILPLLDQAVIHTLITDGYLLDTAQMLELLRHAPHMKSLSFRGSNLNVDIPPSTVSLETLLHTLSLTDDNDKPYVPELEEFECRFVADFSIPTLADFIWNRQTKPDFRKLRRIAITLRRHQEASFELREFLPSSAMEGLEVEIQYAPPS